MDGMSKAEIAQSRWEALTGIESQNKDRGRQAYRFYIGEQWDERDLRKRRTKRRPAMVVNYIKTTVDPVINSVADNLPECQITSAIDGKESESANFCDAAIRQIHYYSNAKAAYRQATTDLVIAGEGYWRVDVEIAELTGAQQIVVRPLHSWESVYVAKHIYDDRSASCCAVVKTPMSRDEARKIFGEEYINIAADSGTFTWDSNANIGEKSSVTVWEYWEKSFVDAILYETEFGLKEEADLANEGLTLDAKNMRFVGGDGLYSIPFGNTVKRKKAKITRSYMIEGVTRLFSTIEWPGSIIPIVMVVAEERAVDGHLYRFGLVEPMVSVQQIINMEYSAAAESLQQLSSTPYIAAAESVMPYRDMWTNMSSDPTAVLLYSHKDSSQQPLPPPTRASQSDTRGVPVLAEVSERYMKSLVGATPDADAADAGGYSSGMRNPTTIPGASWKIANAMRSGIELTGRIILDLMLNLYEPGDVISTRSKNGKGRDIPVSRDDRPGHIVLNDGFYSIEANAAVDDETQNKRSFELLAETIKSSPPLGQIVGDLLFTSAKLPMSAEIARRIRMKMDPILFEGPEKIDAMLNNSMNEVKSLKSAMQQKDAEIADLRFKLKADSAHAASSLEGVRLKEENAAYRAETDRLKAVMPAVSEGFIPASVLRPIVQQLLVEMFSQSMSNPSAAPPVTAMPNQPMEGSV